MSTESIVMKIEQLSEELQQEVSDYIEFLLYKYNHQTRRIRQEKPLSESGGGSAN